ncbi:MAG: nucleotide exchange factor GrpE [Pseudonocardia sp.]
MNEHLTNEHIDDRIVGADTPKNWSTPTAPDSELAGVGSSENPHDVKTGSSIKGNGGDGHQPDPDPVDSPPTESLSLEVLTDAVQSLRDALSASLRTQEHQQALLDKLHDEKEKLRETEHRRQRDPVLRDLIQLSDTCLRNSRQWRGRSDVSQETVDRVGAALHEVAADVKLILERQGVEDFVPMIDDKFARSESKAVGTRLTSDATQDGLVAEVRKPGYRLGDRVLRFSEVVVWRFEPDLAATEET